jgi:hypothetical protein
MARVFAVMVQILLRAGAIAIQVRSEPRIYPRLQNSWWALAQCRGTNYLGARNLSRCRILIAGKCACPGATTITNLSWCKSKSKNRDKQLTHIVRVSGWLLFIYCPDIVNYRSSPLYKFKNRSHYSAKIILKS